MFKLMVKKILTILCSKFLFIQTCEALEGFLGIQGYWPKYYRDTGYFCKCLKGYGILGSNLGKWGTMISEFWGYLPFLF